MRSYTRILSLSEL